MIPSNDISIRSRFIWKENRSHPFFFWVYFKQIPHIFCYTPLGGSPLLCHIPRRSIRYSRYDCCSCALKKIRMFHLTPPGGFSMFVHVCFHICVFPAFHFGSRSMPRFGFPLPPNPLELSEGSARNFGQTSQGDSGIFATLAALHLSWGKALKGLRGFQRASGGALEGPGRP